MADKTHSLIVAALQRAVAEPGGLPLFGTKNKPGLFANSAGARVAADQCKNDSYLRIVATEATGKSARETYAITEQGLAFLLAETSPKQVLEALVAALEARQVQLAELLTTTRHTQASLDSLKATAERVLRDVGPDSGRIGILPHEKDVVLDHLSRRQAKRNLDDCPLPELYRAAQRTTPALTIGQFHDGLRRLHERRQIYLHPWTGPLYELPEPALALLAGHEVAYYASLCPASAESSLADETMEPVTA